MTKTSGIIAWLGLGLMSAALPACSSSSDGGGTAGGSSAGSSGSGSSSAGSSGSGSDFAGSSNVAGSGGSDNSTGGTGAASMAEIAECQKAQAAECKQIFACVPADQLMQLADQIGTSESDCVAKIAAADPCTDATCSSGTFDAAQAEKCVNATAALSCDDFIMDVQQQTEPAECDTVCSN